MYESGCQNEIRCGLAPLFILGGALLLFRNAYEPSEANFYPSPLFFFSSWGYSLDVRDGAGMGTAPVLRLFHF